MAVSEKYRMKFLEMLADHPEGVETKEIRVSFPRAPLLEMERAGLIEYRKDRWHVVGKIKE